MPKQAEHKTLPQEAQLLEALGQGSAVAYKTLYYWYQPRLLRFIAPFADSDAEGEDTVQEVLFKLWARRETMIGIASLEQYLLRMTKNQLLDGRRKMAVEQKHLKALYTTPTEAPTVIAAYTFKEYIAAATAAINRLPEKQKTVFLLRHQQDYTLHQIAAMTGSSWEAVHKNLVRAVRFIKQHLRENSDWFVVFLLFFGNSYNHSCILSQLF